MKKTLMILIVFLSFASSVFSAEEANNLHVVFDAKALTGQTVNVAFTSRAIANEPDPSQGGASSNFKAFENFKPEEIVPSIVLGIKNIDNGLRGVNVGPLFVSFQVYSSVPMQVVIKQSGPLQQDPDVPALQINWQVFLGDMDSQVFVDSANSGSSLVAYKSSPSNFGISGSRKLTIKTQELTPDMLGTYKASIIAEIITIE